jgi:hypothetical protein
MLHNIVLALAQKPVTPARSFAFVLPYALSLVMAYALTQIPVLGTFDLTAF